MDQRRVAVADLRVCERDGRLDGNGGNDGAHALRVYEIRLARMVRFDEYEPLTQPGRTENGIASFDLDLDGIEEKFLLGSWSSTLQQFQFDFHVALLSPIAAPLLGTFGEIVFPPLLFIGLTARLAALGLLIVNAVAVMSASYLYPDGLADPAFGGHYLRGALLLVALVYGPGRWSLDYLLSRRMGLPAERVT